MKLIFRYLKPFYSLMSLGLIIKITASIVELAIPYILEYIIDDLVPKKEMNLILVFGGLMIVCSAIAFIGNVWANRIASKVARNSTEKIRHDLFSKVMYLSASDIDSFTIPSLESRLTSDTYQIHHVVGMMQRLGIRAPIMLIGGIAVTLTLDPVLTLVMASTLPFIALTVFFVSKKGIPLYTNVQKGVDTVTRVVRENSNGVRVVKALSKTDYEIRHFDAANRDLVKLEKKAALTMALTNPFMTLILNLGLATVIFAGAYRVKNGLCDAGVIIAFMSYFAIVTTGMMAITRIFVMLSRGIASAKRIGEVLETKEKLAPNAELPCKEGCRDYIKFEHVNFSYIKGKHVLHDIDFSLPKGGTLGIIGATGSGKTTIISLLMRFYDADSGRILIDGRDVRSYEPSELYSKIGIVRQNDFLYNDTIEENIKFGREISHDDVVYAAKTACADEFINETEGGYGHILTAKGTNVSGGQKQRLLIARALAAKPEILILDDSSSALDYKTDAMLRHAVKENYGGTTTVIVAQRISSIMSADLILVIDEGRAVASGTHEELLSSCEVYREISESQMGGAILE